MLKTSRFFQIITLTRLFQLLQKQGSFCLSAVSKKVSTISMRSEILMNWKQISESSYDNSLIKNQQEIITHSIKIFFELRNSYQGQARTISSVISALLYRLIFLCKNVDWLFYKAYKKRSYVWNFYSPAPQQSVAVKLSSLKLVFSSTKIDQWSHVSWWRRLKIINASEPNLVTSWIAFAK